MIKNHRAILYSNVGTLPVQSCRIMVRPENIQKFVITDLRRIEFHFHYLDVSGLIGADILIRWILFCSPCVPDRCGQNALQIAESFFHSPETACAECGLLRLHTKMMLRLLATRNQVLCWCKRTQMKGSAKLLQGEATLCARTAHRISLDS